MGSLPCEKRTKILQVIFFITLFFTVSCSKETGLSSCLTSEEKADLDYFFRLILFDEPGGSFVLFGNKPLCEISYFDTEGDQNSPFRRNPAKGWRALQKVLPASSLKRYLFTLRPENGGFIVLADIQKTALVLAENYDVFKTCTGLDFHPLEIVFELESPNSKFWNKIFSYQDHLPLGILFGFGKQNALLWTWNIQFQEKSGKPSDYLRMNPMFTSTPRVHIESGMLARHKIRIGRGPEDFDIPFFGTTEGDKTVERFRLEKKNIEKTYRGKDLVETTLKRLTS